MEFYGEHESEVSTSQILFLPGQGRLVTLTEDNFLHLWEINGLSLEEKKSTHLDGRLKKISVLCLVPSADNAGSLILLGTEGGNIYHLDADRFTVTEDLIYQDLVAKGAPDFKVNPGAVEALIAQPGQPGRLLIGYARGLIVLWDRLAGRAVASFVASQQLESLAWRSDGSQFVSSHNDGSFVVWSAEGNSGPESAEPLEPPNTPYGPYPCKAIGKILWAHDSGTSFTVFGGGMPRASYGDKFTVTVMKNSGGGSAGSDEDGGGESGGEDDDDGSKHSVLDLTSKVVDFLLAGKTLLVLAEEELVAVDLSEESWPPVPSPYLNAIHASAVTCLAHATDVTPRVAQWLREAAAKERGTGGKGVWPAVGGKVEESRAADATEDLLVTGHEDGSVKIWSCAGVSLSPLAVVRTNRYFLGDDLDEPPPENGDDEEEEEDEWPPFRKVGHYDPYSDDPRLAVKKVALCGRSGRLVVGGTAGQVIVFELSDPSAADQPSTAEPIRVKADLVTEKEGFTWKGHSALAAREKALPQKGAKAAFTAKTIVQVSPPASINSLALSNSWGLVAAGTAHGLVLLDALLNAAVVAKCTLNAQGRRKMLHPHTMWLLVWESGFLCAQDREVGNLEYKDGGGVSRRLDVSVSG